MNPMQFSDKVKWITIFLEGKLPGGYAPYVVFNVGNKKGRAKEGRANKGRATNANESGGNAV